MACSSELCCELLLLPNMADKGCLVFAKAVDWVVMSAPVDV